MRVAVTGSSGYLGRPIVAALAADERVDEVAAIDARPPRAAAAPGVVQRQRDVRDPRLEEDLAGADALVHLAFYVLGRGAGADSVNIDGSRNTFEAAIRAGVSTIVYASSSAAYGCAPDNPVPLTEDDALRGIPPFYYPRTKAAVERMLDELGARHPGVRIVRMRPVATLGPGAPRLGTGRTFVMLKDFDPLMQFTWLDDVVAAFVAPLHTASASGAFNVGAPGPVPASHVARLMGVRRVRLPYRVLRGAARVAQRLRLPGALDPGWVDMTRYPIVVDTTRAERELGWRAGCDCATVLRRYGELLRTPARERAALTFATREAR